MGSSCCSYGYGARASTALVVVMLCGIFSVLPLAESSGELRSNSGGDTWAGLKLIDWAAGIVNPPLSLVQTVFYFPGASFPKPWVIDFVLGFVAAVAWEEIRTYRERKIYDAWSYHYEVIDYGGKHKGKTFHEAFRTDSAYVWWTLKNSTTSRQSVLFKRYCVALTGAIDAGEGLDIPHTRMPSARDFVKWGLLLFLTYVVYWWGAHVSFAMFCYFDRFVPVMGFVFRVEAAVAPAAGPAPPPLAPSLLQQAAATAYGCAGWDAG